MRRVRGILRVGVGLTSVVALVAAAGPVVAPFGPRELAGPAYAPPSWTHLLGTNDIGQDIFSQLVHGARGSLLVAVLAATITTVVATVVGAGGALLGGRTDRAVGHVLDVVLAFPGLPLIIVIGSLVDPTGPVLAVIIGFVGWPPLARLVRSQTQSLRSGGHVRAAHGFGRHPARVLTAHLVPPLAPILVAGFVEWAATAVSLEAGLALLGLGDPLAVSWGTMLNRALSQPGLYFTDLWLRWVLPTGVAITALVSGLTLTGVGLERWFDPREPSTPVEESTGILPGAIGP